MKMPALLKRKRPTPEVADQADISGHVWTKEQLTCLHKDHAGSYNPHHKLMTIRCLTCLKVEGYKRDARGIWQPYALREDQIRTLQERE